MSMIPENRFYQVTIKIQSEDENTGKIKKYSEIHLVDAKDTTEIANKVAKEMKDRFEIWEIVSIVVSKIGCVYS